MLTRSENVETAAQRRPKVDTQREDTQEKAVLLLHNKSDHLGLVHFEKWCNAYLRSKSFLKCYHSPDATLPSRQSEYSSPPSRPEGIHRRCARLAISCDEGLALFQGGPGLN